MKQRRDRKMKKWMKKAAEYGKRHRKLTASAAAVLALCLVVAAGAVMVLGASYPKAVQADADTLAKTLLRNGISCEDAVVLGGSVGEQYASFTGLQEEYGFSEGIILSTGKATRAFSSTSNSMGTKGPDDTDSITGKACEYLRRLRDANNIDAGLSPWYWSDGTQYREWREDIYDPAVFAVKVTPATDDLSLRYFYAANEYHMRAKYNDTIAIWVVQDFGGKDERWTNISRIPEDRLPEGANSSQVFIQNICPDSPKNYKSSTGIYKYNGGNIIAYQGVTEPLYAQIGDLVPGKPVWVVMAVADVEGNSRDSALFIEAGSLRFAQSGSVNITYDADGGTFESTGERKTVCTMPVDGTYTVGDGVKDPVRPGYAFDGWYTAAGSGKPVEGGSITAEMDTTWYAHWKPVTSMVEVTVKKDGSNMPEDTVVELRKNGLTVCALDENETMWTAEGIPNGTYEVFVNGQDTDSRVTVDAKTQGGTFTADEIHYYTVTADVTLDGSAWSGQSVRLSDGTQLTGSGPYTAVLREKASDNTYTLRVRGEDKGSVEVSESGNRTIAASYHTIGVVINDETEWTDASITLQKDGAAVYSLEYNSRTGRYETILPAEDQECYSVFVDGRDVGRTVSTEKKTAEVTFYTAKVKITGGFANMPVAIANGMDSYSLRGGDTKGTAAYTCSHVLDRNGAAYAVTVGGVAGKVQAAVTNGSTLNIVCHTVTFKNAEDSAHARQYVLDGGKAQNAAIPVKANSVFLGWSSTKGAGKADFDFQTAVKADMTLYPVYEASGIRLGAHIQTGNKSAYTYQMPNLTIRGYVTVSSVVLTVENCASITVGSGVGRQTALDTSGNGTVILTFGKGTSAAAVQKALRDMTVKVKDYKKKHTIRAVVYGSQY